MGKVDILKIAKIAQEAKRINPNVIDATIGMFYDDHKNLIIPRVQKAFYDLNILETFQYGSTDGGKEFEENLLDWVLDDKQKILKSKFQVTGLSTPGGSGALSLLFNAYGNIGDKVLLPSLRWRYEYFLNSAKLSGHEHNLFKDSKFDLEDFQIQLSYLASKQKTVIVVINDPCHNPTGYQLSKNEWHSIINIVNKFENNNIIIAYDIAYFDYNPLGFKEARETFEYFLDLKPHVQVLTAFSASKSFAIYGVRLGGLIGLHHTKEQLDYFKKNVYEDVLGKWSTAPNVGIGIFNKVALQKDEYIIELNKLTSQLKERGDIFIKEAKENSLDIYPYKGGFFVLVKSDNPQYHFEQLINKNIYLIPMNNGLRVALCGITTKEVYGLAKQIKDVVEGK
ncbi:pyridoxal phosphate-dependent aminotransferase [Acholeplasma granularum]|uniref:pyridoxal phosphate-dependent aminotransferase n=1 Tax=Acholeplasma granularum TaxID=264635 RepID=UPI0004714964|nr:aminotransferase class I/II-fold pyridoxal phosphate-dependent enzyme [Acholeplasma granularum]